MSMDLGILDMLALLAILLVGVPHGAADAQLAARGQLAKTPTALFGFMVGYTALTLGFIALWFIVPVLALPLFFAMSAYHFGRGDALAHKTSPSPIDALAHGGVIFLIPLFHGDIVTPILTYLTGFEGGFTQFFAIGALAWLASCAYAAATARLSRPAALEIIALAALFIVLPPLPAFAIYFVGIHSARHFQRLFAFGLNSWRAQLPAVMIAIASIATITIAAPLLDTADINSGLMKAIFIGLAGLTVPHMLLIDGVDILARTEKEAQHG